MRRDYTPKTHYRQMTRKKADEIRRAYFGREANQCELAKRHGLRQSSVSRIISGQVWV
jgi:DNA-binding transcriptional regulator LsrR (DeoR family)